MGHPCPPQPVRPILGMIAGNTGDFAEALACVRPRWGQPDLESEVFDFHFTNYYAAHMGEDLKRRFFSFDVKLDPADLPDVKLWTNEIEGRLAAQAAGSEARPVNLDPGYVNDSKLVLATTKDHAHRVYLGKGIYGEVTLSYHHGTWHPFPWTYPDYRSSLYHPFLEEVRSRYLRAREP